MGGSRLPLTSPGHRAWPVAPGTTSVLREDGTDVPAAEWESRTVQHGDLRANRFGFGRELFAMMRAQVGTAEAERLILRGFFQDVLDRIDLEPVREALSEALEARIPQG